MIIMLLRSTIDKESLLTDHACPVNRVRVQKTLHDIRLKEYELTVPRGTARASGDITV